MAEILLKDIEMTLTARSIGNAIKTVNKLKDKLADALSELARYLTEDLGVGVVQMFIYQFPAIDTSALSDSFNGAYNKAEHEGNIWTDIEYAVLVEYGTGIVGAENPHPGMHDENWNNVSSTTVDGKTYSEYDSRHHGAAGWWYPAPWGWVEAEDGNMLAWTRGMPSRPFMYYTLRELESQAESHGGQIIARCIMG